MHLFIAGIDCSNSVQDRGITRGEVYRAVKSRVTLGGKRYVSRVKKLSYDISFDPMEGSKLKTLIEALDSDLVSMTYKDPVLGMISKQFIPTPKPVELVLEDRNGITYWSGLELNLEEH